MRTLGVVTVGRSDYGLLTPVMSRIVMDPGLELQVFVGGMHLSPDSGMTVKQIEADGFPIADRIEMTPASDDPEAISKAMGVGTVGFAQAFSSHRPDILLLLGDRFEMHAAAVAALPFCIPVAHIHGGEITEGAFDDALRHSMTKLSHLHFASTKEHAERLLQLGEEPWRVTVSGAPGLDNMVRIPLLPAEEIKRKFGVSLDPAPLLATFHPATLEYQHTECQTTQMLEAIAAVGLPAVFTLPNVDTGSRAITGLIREFVSRNSAAALVENFGTQAYLSVMAKSAAMVGNSSSGIIEAASFSLPVVNIGTRQKGRTRGANVIDVGYTSQEIVEGIRTAVSLAFRARIKGMANPYGDGRASEIIVERLKSVPLGEQLIRKVFCAVGARANV